MTNKKTFLAIGTTIDYFNDTTKTKVKLKIQESKPYNCDGCYFCGIDRHCPNQWDCGKEARADKKAIIFKQIKQKSAKTFKSALALRITLSLCGQS